MVIFLQSLRLFVWMTILTGILYPLFITGIAYVAFREKAAGSIIISQGHVLGSKLIGQKFESNRYFWSRPSAIDYKPLPSGGSNLSQTSAKLKQQVADRRHAIAQAHGISNEAAIPPELIFSSGSGLDPHISLKTAYFQLDRIAKARGLDNDLDKGKIKKIIDSTSEYQYVNVLLVNQELDHLSKERSS